jgi:sec-independent protein translocase protein TatA
MFGLGTSELMLILAIVVIFFGVGKLPEVARQLGGGIKTFKDAVNGEESLPEQKE